MVIVPKKYNPVYKDIEVNQNIEILSNLEDIFNQLQFNDHDKNECNDDVDDDDHHSVDTSSISSSEDDDTGAHFGPVDMNEDDVILETGVSGTSDNNHTKESQKIWT